ncbi:MAG: FkbM family methyltransferase [Proteobacteria bacterium]|nr:FkbM family methyltransferase [Pseudomonadota bacterium]NOG61730.1 FkbM family methyltransferase [Pseudomonadota bacterium]
MKITFHKKIAAYFGYDFIRISNNIYDNQNSHIQELIKKQKIDLVLDVGANVGQFSLDLRNAGYNGEIISFEPIKECYEQLISIADDNWHIENYALGDNESSQDINISKKSVFSSILETSDFGEKNFSESIGIIKKQRIQIHQLDHVIPDIINNIDKRRIFMKLDTQGYDSRVLCGANKTLKSVYAIQTEVSCKAIYQDTPTHHETLKHLSELGFNITGIFPLSHDDETMELLEFDCVLSKTE